MKPYTVVTQWKNREGLTVDHVDCHGPDGVVDEMLEERRRMIEGDVSHDDIAATVVFSGHLTEEDEEIATDETRSYGPQGRIN